MSEDFRRLPKTFEEEPRMFRWYTNQFKYNLRDKRNLIISEIIDIFTCEDIISLHVRILYRFYQFVTTPWTTDFYIIKVRNIPCSQLEFRVRDFRCVSEICLAILGCSRMLLIFGTSQSEHFILKDVTWLQRVEVFQAHSFSAFSRSVLPLGVYSPRFDLFAWNFVPSESHI